MCITIRIGTCIRTNKDAISTDIGNIVCIIDFSAIGTQNNITRVIGNGFITNRNRIFFSCLAARTHNHSIIGRRSITCAHNNTILPCS